MPRELRAKIHVCRDPMTGKYVRCKTPKKIKK